MTRVFLFIIGFILLVYNFSVLILYLNIMTIGYNFSDYVNFIIRKPELYLFIIGLILTIIPKKKRRR